MYPQNMQIHLLYTIHFAFITQLSDTIDKKTCKDDKYTDHLQTIHPLFQENITEYRDQDIAEGIKDRIEGQSDTFK